MISPAEIKQKAERIFVDYLRSIITEENIFPMDIRSNKSVGNSLAEYKKNVDKIISESKFKKAYGYSIDFENRKTKNLGTQSFPVNIYFETETDYLKFINREKEAECFKNEYKSILSEFTELKEWIIKHPQKIVNNCSVWKDILKVCRYFKTNPKPNLYIRELPVKVHTKFIERNKGIIKELLDIIISENINSKKTSFEKRFNLKYSEPLIRLRILDDEISANILSGLSDLSIPVSQFINFEIKNIETVYVVENEMNLLTFPENPSSIAIWGKGFQVSNLKNASWLNKISKFFYWGDLDVHGFEILSQIRGYFNNVQSILMDETTFNKFFEGDKGAISNTQIKLNLTSEEYQLYNKIKENRWRLEQEKIPLPYLIEKLNETYPSHKPTQIPKLNNK